MCVKALSAWVRGASTQQLTVLAVQRQQSFSMTLMAMEGAWLRAQLQLSPPTSSWCRCACVRCQSSLQVRALISQALISTHLLYLPSNQRVNVDVQERQRSRM